MLRISNRMMYNNTLINAFRNNQGLLRAQEELSSGKRINRPSDDPNGMMEVLELRTSIGKSNQYLKVMNNAESVLNTADSTIGAVHDQLKIAKELSLQQAGGAASATTRVTSAVTIDNMIEQMVQYGNTRVGSKYIFSGQRSDQTAVDSQGRYTGSGTDLQLEISQGLEIPISVKASDFLTTDMNPSISGTTTLASLKGGTGVPAGTFTVNDRNSATGAVTIDTTAMTTVQEVINAINGAGLNLTASISTDGTSLVVTDSTVGPDQALSISSTVTSRALGINGTQNNSVITGDNLDAAVTDTTLLSNLYGGKGLQLNNITLTHGSASATVTFSTETTVGAVRATINAVATTINASVTIDGGGRMLSINSTGATSGTVSFAVDSGSGNTAELLGIGGGRNVIPILQKLSAALKRDDQSGILVSLGLLDSTMDNASSIRGQVGSRANQVVSTRESMDLSIFDSTRVKSIVEDADFLKSASELAMLQTAYQATLKSSAAIIQPSLMDFV